MVNQAPVGFVCVFFTIKFVGFCQRTSWQHAIHTVSKERGGDYRAMASCQSVLWNGQKTGGLSLRVKRDEKVGVWWLDGVDVSVMAWCQTLCLFQCQHINPSLVFDEQSHVYQSQRVLASSTNFMVLTCPAKCGHCARHSESGMALEMIECRAAISPMFSHPQHCESCHTMCTSFCSMNEKSGCL